MAAEVLSCTYIFVRVQELSASFLLIYLEHVICALIPNPILYLRSALI